MATGTPAQSVVQELVASHVLAMQCGGRAEQFLARAAAGPAGRDARSDDEALRMGALFSRLVENVRRGTILAGRAPAFVPADVGAGVSPARAAKPKLHAAPDARRGRLKNGNPSGDYLRAPRCCARTRAGCPCRQPAMKNGRCRMHGGLSTGPRTPDGRRRAQTARLVHGYRTAELIGLRSRAVHAARRLRALNAAARSAGHGVDRSDSFRAANRADLRSGADLRSAHSCAAAIFPAGHGVDRPDSFRRAAVG